MTCSFCRAVLTIMLLTLSSESFAEDSSTPWFTGSLLAPTAVSIPVGHQNYQPYLFITDNVGVYNNRSHIVHETQTHTTSPMMIYSQGLADRLDYQLTAPYDFNSQNPQSTSGLSDITLLLGYQLLYDHDNSWKPSVRLTVSEIFPTGRYTNLDPNKPAVDATGAGSYQTGLSIVLQKLKHVYDNHYLRTRYSFVYTLPTSLTVQNFNSYGGAIGTRGKVNPGNKFATDLAFEYTLTQHWVSAIDLYYTHSVKTTFSGNPGITKTGSVPIIGQSGGSEFSLAPALEYNISKNLGIIAGAWFSLHGRNSADFKSAVLSVNYYH